MIRLKYMSKDGLTTLTRLRNEIISKCSDPYSDTHEGRLELADDIIKIIDKYLQNPLEIQFVVDFKSDTKVILTPISQQAVQLFRLLEL